MATPYSNVSSGSKDNYNFYHSQVSFQRVFSLFWTESNCFFAKKNCTQLRIRVECAFGMLVQRWGILRTAIPRGVSIKRTIALVNALVKLHNFCIDNSNPESTEEEVTMQQSTSADDFNIMNNRDGFVPLEREEHDGGGGRSLVPRQLLDAGNHFEDVPMNVFRTKCKYKYGH